MRSARVAPSVRIFDGGVSPIIPYNDSAILNLGRWNSTGAGDWTGWAGAQKAFKVSGTLNLRVFASVIDTDTTNLTFLASIVDNNNGASSINYFTTQAQIYTGLCYADIPIPDINEHTIIVHTSGLPAGMMAQTCKTIITGYMVDYGGHVLPWTQGTKVLQNVGDSWMGAQADWPRLQSRTRWKLYPIGSGGLTCAQMDGYYNYQYGSTLASDVAANAAEVSFGVNDFNAGITNASFETSMYALFDKIRAKQPTAPIMMIRVPKNLNTGNDFGKYGVNMSNVAAARSNAYYCDTTSLDTSLQPYWDADGFHLVTTGKQILADFVDAAWTTIGI